MVSKIINMIKNLIRLGRVSNTNSDNNNYPFNQFSYLGKAKDIVCIYPYGFSANAPLNNLGILFNFGQEEKTLGLPISGTDRIKGLKPGEIVIGNWETKSFVKFKEDKSIEIVSLEDLDVTVSGNVNITVSGTANITSTGNTNITAPLVDITGDLEVSGTIDSGSTITSGTDIVATTSVDAGTTVTATTTLSGATISGGGITATGGTLSAGTDVTAGGISLTGHTHSGVTVGGGSTGGPQ